MKKIFLLVGCITLILFSCQKRHDPSRATHQKPGLTNPDGKKLAFKVIDIYSQLSSIRRRIDIINKATNVVLGKMFITLSCNDPNDDLKRKIKYEPEKFSGQITLESRHLIRCTKRILNGKLVKVENLVGKEVDEASKPGIKADPEFDPVSSSTIDPVNSTDFHCPLFEIAACANTRIYNMYWLDYAFCAIEGNICLLKNFGICGDQICK